MIVDVMTCLEIPKEALSGNVARSKPEMGEPQAYRLQL